MSSPAPVPGRRQSQAGRPAPSMSPAGPDAVVIGAGPNGLVAANLLADAGWSVLVLEAQPEPGGAVRSARILGPEVVTDLFSAFYPLAVASPVFRRLRLEEHGLTWAHAPAVLAHPLGDGRCVLLHRDLEATVDGLEALAPGNGVAYRRLHALWRQLAPALLDALFTPFPPLGAVARLVAVLRVSGLLRFARFALLPVRSLAEEEFGGGPAAMLFAGNALHTDLAPEAAGSALYGWLLTMLGQDFGWPVPRGGAGSLTAALVRRLESRGGEVRCSTPVRRVLLRHGRASGVVTDAGEIAVRRAVLADVDAPRLYQELVGAAALPDRLREDLGRFQWDYPTLKVNWLIEGGVPWSTPEPSLAGTVHLAPGLDDLTAFAADLARGRVPAVPFTLLGQMTTADRTRSPVGTESLWAYTHLPRQVRGDAAAGGAIRGDWSGPDTDAVASRLEDHIARFAPDFRARIRARTVQSPYDLNADDANLNLGALGGGTSSLHQQLVLRPVPGLGRPGTPFAGLYLASASAHPGGGVHGACGANAARVALREHGPLRRRFRPVR